MALKNIQGSMVGPAMPVVSLREVSAGYINRSVLHELTLDIEPGISVLLGTNGAGKTTLFRVIAGVLGARLGNVLVYGQNPFQETGVKRRIGYLSHRSGLSSSLTVRDNLTFWGKIIGLPASEIEVRISDLMALLKIPDLVDCPIQALSRGQIQRIALVRCFLGTPDLLLLDEPTTGLDPVAIRDFFRHLNQIKANGLTIIYSTHNVFEAQQFSAKTIIMANGKIFAQGEADRLCQKYLGRVTVTIRTNGDPRVALDKLGYDFLCENGYWHVRIPRREEKSLLLQNLAEFGLNVTEISNRPEDLGDLLEEATNGHAR